MDYLASMYIDNEMDLDEKRRFVEKVRSDHAFYALTLTLLDQENLLRQPLVLAETMTVEKKRRQPVSLWLLRLLKPVGFAAAGFVAALLIFFATPEDPGPMVHSNRFILFAPAVDQVELVGSFAGWRRIAMRRVGDSGYWELNLAIPPGVHRFAYIVDGDRRMPDPTLPASEQDDFGGQNSILTVEERI